MNFIDAMILHNKNPDRFSIGRTQSGVLMLFESVCEQFNKKYFLVFPDDCKIPFMYTVIDKSTYTSVIIDRNGYVIL